ncbi:MAG: hypothetical protein ACRDHO_12770 [Actinomycetota bacterium]
MADASEQPRRPGAPDIPAVRPSRWFSRNLLRYQAVVVALSFALFGVSRWVGGDSLPGSLEVSYMFLVSLAVTTLLVSPVYLWLIWQSGLRWRGPGGRLVVVLLAAIFGIVPWLIASVLINPDALELLPPYLIALWLGCGLATQLPPGPRLVHAEQGAQREGDQCRETCRTPFRPGKRRRAI